MRKRAFSLAEILIATMFMGIIASLTIPSTINSLKYKEHVTAYKNAFEKVKQVTSSSGISDKTLMSAEKFWAQLSDALPVIGYSVAGIKANGVVDDPCPTVPMTASNLYEKATWTNGTDSMTIGSKTGSTVTQNGGWSPWIITENGMAFMVRSFPGGYVDSNFSDGKCGTVSNIFHAQAQNGVSIIDMAAAASCVVVFVDVNGLDKGPNSYTAPVAVTEGEAYNLIRDKDRFFIFVGLDGVSSGPEGNVSYFITKGN